MKVIIMMGFPGSGKSTWANLLGGNSVIVSSDNYFTDKDGNYNWKIEEAHKGHEDCLRKFIDVFQPGPPSGDPEKKPDFVIVDNTNLKLCDISVYIRIAQAYGYYDIEVNYIDVDIEICKARNIHKVPESAYDRMQKNFQFLINNWPQDFPAIEYINSDDPFYKGGCGHGLSSEQIQTLLEDQIEFDLVLEDIGENKISVIQCMRMKYSISLNESFELIKKLPQVIAKDLSKYSAEYDKKIFEELGAKVKIC